jgi:hypothetical protein
MTSRIDISPEAAAKMIQSLRGPHYWMSGSDQGHEGENDVPYRSADMLEAFAARVAELEAVKAQAYRDGWAFAFRQCKATGSVPDPDYCPVEVGP